MSGLLDDAWHVRDFPTLKAAAAIADRNFTGARVGEITEQTGLSRDDTLLAFRALESAGLVEISWATGDGSRVSRLAAEARQLVGLWPSPDTAADRLIAALEAAIERADDVEQKSRLQKVRDGLLAAGRDVIVSVGAAVITGQL